MDQMFLPKRSKTKLVVAIVGSLVFVVVGIVIAIVFFTAPQIKVPANIVKAAKSDIYMPANLPGNYVVDNQSFMVAEQGVIIFKAVDGAGGQIVFTEQTKPKDFSFDDFYKQQVQEAKTLNNVPFPSVFGKGNLGQRLVSIVAKDTWIIATTQSPLNESDFREIAESVRLYAQ